MGDTKDSSPPADEQRFSGVSLERRRQGEFHAPHHEPVQLLSFHSEPIQYGGAGTFAPDPLPPPAISADDNEVDMDSETPVVYQLASEISSQYKKPDIYDDIDKYEDMRRGLKEKHRSSCVPCLTLCLTLLALLIGTGGLGVALYHFLFESSSDCSCDGSIASLETQLQESQARLLGLEQTVMELRDGYSASSGSPVGSNILLRVDELETQVDGISTILANLTEVTDGNSTPNSTQAPPTVKELSLYENCTMSLISSCRIDTQFLTDTLEPAFSVCETGTYSLNQADYYTVDIHCGIVNTNSQSNPIITTLNIDGAANKAKCLCYRNHLVQSSGTPECGLYVTRCSSTYRLEL